jgi:hypothetical protein
MPLCKLPGGLLALHVAYAWVRGEEYVNSRGSGKTLRRDGLPAAFRAAIAVCGLLALALPTAF